MWWHPLKIHEVGQISSSYGEWERVHGGEAHNYEASQNLISWKNRKINNLEVTRTISADGKKRKKVNEILIKNYEWK